ncbi:sugar ABC transporter permease [bacterium]|nr:sugar ABC transporter permease [bacterium]
MKQLQKSYFIILVVFMAILQYMLYDRTLRMDRFEKGALYLKTEASKITSSIEKSDYQSVVPKTVEESKGYFSEIYLFSENQNSGYDFLVNRELKNHTVKKDLSDLHRKNLYDSCENPQKVTQFENIFLYAEKTKDSCIVFQMGKISLGEPSNGPLGYALIAILLIIAAIFVFNPEEKKNRIVLSIALLASVVLSFILSITDAKTVGYEKISEITVGNINKLMIIFAVMIILFSLFYITNLSVRCSNTLLKHRAPYLYIVPGGIGILFLSFIPLISGILLSFFQVRYNSYNFVWFDNYIDIVIGGLKDIANPKGFYYTFFITVVWTAINIFFHVSVGMGIALIINRKGLKFKKLYSIIFIIPWAIPNYITALIWKSMFHEQFGAINSALELIGFEKISWFSQTFTAFTANLLTNIWLGFPFMMVMTLGALQSIPEHLYDAAVMDGATKWQQFRHITLPMLKPALLPSIILGTIWTFNMFNVIYLVSGGDPQSKTDILITEAYRWAFERNGRYGYSAAYATIIFAVLFLYNQVTTRIQKKSEAK